MKEFKVFIYAPEKTIFEGDALSLVVPAAKGYLGVLANHAPLIASLKQGKIVIRKNTQEIITIASLGRGYIEVENNTATILLTVSQ
jgi:F-type H+-transporting ATPase subunit epsilon